ncbi:MOSC domain-containing protein [Nostoc sp. FACHB-152]|uniref:MOSC domain-containing protein n=1 Tax=Nostoc sp. FACHB-152 TaxID=2692837 RepID=UPI0028C3DBE4|nr:MOSC domain-containing protein [Nostoc sp. FACHB-152]
MSWKGKPVRTGIFKEPVNSRVMVRELNLDGDRQADLTVHGRVDKAVYVYPLEYYDYWRSELPDTELTPGIFGENFTVTGLREEEKLYVREQNNPELLYRAAQLEALPQSWWDYFQEQIRRQDVR